MFAMDLNELANAVKQTSSDPVALRLSDLLLAWKTDPSDVRELEETVERYIGNTWIASAAEHAKIHSLWSQFRDEVIHGVPGMTVNERLYYFSLFPRWDNAHTDEERTQIYGKVLAHI